MFQDEARFGRLSDPRRCWAPAPLRPVVPVALVREYAYAYAAVSPQDGALDWMLTLKMDTLNMNAFLNHVSRRHVIPLCVQDEPNIHGQPVNDCSP